MKPSTRVKVSKIGMTIVLVCMVLSFVFPDVGFGVLASPLMLFVCLAIYFSYRNKSDEE